MITSVFLAWLVFFFLFLFFFFFLQIHIDCEVRVINIYILQLATLCVLSHLSSHIFFVLKAVVFFLIFDHFETVYKGFSIHNTKAYKVKLQLQIFYIW